MNSGGTLMLPKTLVRLTRNEFRRQVLEADGLRCQNPDCKCHETGTDEYGLDAHHIIPRRRGGDAIENGITLCRLSHVTVEDGLRGKRLMRWILDANRGRSNWRWDAAYQYLVNLIALKELPGSRNG